MRAFSRSIAFMAAVLGVQTAAFGQHAEVVERQRHYSGGPAPGRNVLRQGKGKKTSSSARRANRYGVQYYAGQAYVSYAYADKLKRDEMAMRQFGRQP